MSADQDTTSDLGIGFFGNMTASISHEIKNALAIVNENAGLLGDLALLMDKGRPLSAERLTTIAGNIRRQVQRADDIIRRLNRFAHSAHEPATRIDLREVLAFTVALAERLATMKGITLVLAAGEPVSLVIRPFVLENLLWLCLQRLFVAAGSGGTVELATEAKDGCALVRLRCGSGTQVGPVAAEAARLGQSLLAELQTEIDTDADQGELLLRLPAPACS
ncbi:MAG: histidine kinase dimerization/phospho-acceptor domain-containing protein [Desulfobulbus sp.]|jgi:signal transduction histidine kinase|nr:histidine kinase dimerization/phospho-acceptor domain-containing protein [Desulfobulbus sp.]